MSYVLTTDELVALAGLLGSKVLIGVRLEGAPDTTRGVGSLLQRGLASQISAGTLAINEELRLCVDTLAGFDALLSCTGWVGAQRTPALGIFLRSGTLVAVRERSGGLHEVVWLPTLPVAIGAVAGYAEDLDRAFVEPGVNASAPLDDPAGFRAALDDGRADVLADALGKGLTETGLAAALAGELVRGGTRRFVGTSGFEALDDLDVTLVVVDEREYAISVLPAHLEVARVDAVSANHLIVRWLARAYALSLGNPSPEWSA